MPRLTEAPYMKFPFQVRADGPRLSDRREHVRELVEQVLFTDPGERVYRPEFGAGARTLVFEPADEALKELTHQRLTASLAAALQGEVDPKSLRVDVELDNERLRVLISYTLATIGCSEQQQFVLGAGGDVNG